MAWNRSSGAAKVAPKKSPSKMRGIVAGLVVVALASVCAVLFMGKGEKTVEKVAKERGRIKEVTPAAAPKYKEVAPKKEKVPFWKNPTTNGLNAAQIRKWKWEHRPIPSWTNTSAWTDAKAKYEIFDTYIENQIAALISIEPGETLVGMPEYGNEKDTFLKSCEVPIIPTDKDDEFTRELKKAMNETKIELRRRMDAGEDFATIMREAHGELQRLGQVRQELHAMVQEELAKATSEDDASALIEAANKMLEAKGLKALSDSPVIRQNIRQMVRMNRRELEANKEQ